MAYPVLEFSLMRGLPDPIQDLIDALERLPGVGPKTASRLVFHLVKGTDDLPQSLAQALISLRSNIKSCPICFNIMDASRETCDICSDMNRNGKVICVVEEPLDALMLERAGVFDGIYHVLQGVLSPIEGIGPEDIRITALVERVTTGKVEEVILATNPSMEGDATALYIRQVLQKSSIKITRLARGLPTGSDLEYADQNTLVRALTGRQEMQ